MRKHMSVVMVLELNFCNSY